MEEKENDFTSSFSPLNYDTEFRMFLFYMGPSSSFIKYLLCATEQVLYKNVIVNFYYKWQTGAINISNGPMRKVSLTVGGYVS